MTDFESQRDTILKAIEGRPDIRERVLYLIKELSDLNYAYCFDWLGVPIIQSPFDIVQIQHLIWQVKPDVIIETGIARGGSLVLSASMLELLGGDHRKVIGIDIDIREHTRTALAAHPLARRIQTIEGSSIAPETAAKVKAAVGDAKQVLVMLDSDHTHDHVLKELELYAPYVKKGAYIIVMDTLIDDMPAEIFTHRHWGPGNNPKTAVNAFVQANPRFRVRHDFNHKLLFTAAMDGYLECIAD